MKPRLIAMLLLAATLAAGLVLFRFPAKPAKPAVNSSAAASPMNFTSAPAQSAGTSKPASPVAGTSPSPIVASSEVTNVSTNRLERLAYLRQQFQLLAAGNPRAAMTSAKQLTNDVERETALLALVTQWTQGDLSSPAERASAIDRYGLEVGLGMELVKNPELAVAWANELTSGQGRAALLAQTAVGLVSSDASAAFALADQLAPEERNAFQNAVLAGWAAKDTEAALWWANQLPEGAERDGALQAIRSVAPVGIGAELAMREGYPVINGLLPGTPAELNGQLQRGDRIVALAQGDNSFVDTHGLTLQQIVQMIRGAPGTTLQLQVVSADAAPGAPPQTISILRDQLKFKR